MSTRTLGLLLAVALVFTGCSDADDDPVATLASVTPAPPAPPATAPPTKDLGFGTAPPQMATTADLAKVEGATGYTMRLGYLPFKMPGLCGDVIDYTKVWRSVAVNDAGKQLFGETIFELADAAEAEAFIASLQSAEQGCTWERPPLTFEYVQQETGLKPIGDSSFALRARIGRIAEGAAEQPVILAYVQVGKLVVHVHVPASANVELVNQVLASALA